MKNKKKEMKQKEMTQEEMTQEEMCRSCPDYPCTMAVLMGIAPDEGADSNPDIQIWERVNRKGDENHAQAEATADMENGKAPEEAADGTDISDEKMEQILTDLYNEILKLLAEDESPETVERQMVNDMVYLCTLVSSINSALYYLATGRMDPVTACKHGSATVRTADRVLEKWQMYSQNQM